MQDRAALFELLRWQIEAGADEAIEEAPVDRFAARQRPAAALQARPAATPVAPAAPVSPAAGGARAVAEAAADLAALEAALRGFEGCALKKTATNTVFADGNPEAKLMI